MKNKKLLFLAITLFWSFGSYTVIAQNCIQCDENCNPSGNYSSVMGMSSTASADMALAGGYNSHAHGAFSIAYGNQVLTNGANSFAFGRFVEATATSAMVFGSGFDLNNKLKNNNTSSLMIGFNSNVPTFLVEGNAGLNRTGRIGIGNVTSPQAKLHIRADENYDTASVFIQAFNDNKPAYLWMGNKNFGIHKHSTTLEFLSTKDFLFNNNVGIGTTSSPTEKLVVNGNIKQAEGYQIETDKLVSKGRNGLKLFTAFNSGIFIDSRGQVAIGKTTPATTLDVNGKIKANALQIPDPVPPDNNGRDIKGYVLTSLDTYGNVRWVPQSSLDDGDWDKNGDNVSKTTGKVGIGTSNPTQTLEVQGTLRVSPSSAGSSGLFVNAEGLVGIGTTTMAGYKLAVAGKIRSTEVTIEHIDDWYDCVFEEDYPLTPLAEIEQFVKQNKHLPEVPSEAEVKANGINLGEMNAILLKKIEELTLHVIQQQKEIDALKKGM